MSNLPANPSESTKRRNPHLYGSEFWKSRKAQSLEQSKPSAKRVRQSSKGMNKLESQWLEVLKSDYQEHHIKSHALTFKLANGLRYTPDFTVLEFGDVLRCYEVKGPHAFDGALDKLKMAAHEWKQCKWILVWKQSGQWQQQHILP